MTYQETLERFQKALRALHEAEHGFFTTVVVYNQIESIMRDLQAHGHINEWATFRIRSYSDVPPEELQELFGNPEAPPGFYIQITIPKHKRR